jgi:hypothetical protein
MTMAATAKPRSDSKLDTLRPKLRDELRDGLLCGWSYDAANKWLHAECGFSVAPSTFTRFYKRHCAPIIRDRTQLAAAKAEAIGAMAGETDWDAASVESLRQMVFDFMARPEADPEAIERLFKLLLKRKDQELTERRVQVLEAKARQADAVKQVLKSSLAPEEQAKRIREILK